MNSDMPEQRKRTTWADVQKNPTFYRHALSDHEGENFNWHNYASLPHSSQVFCVSAFGTLRRLRSRDFVINQLLSSPGCCRTDSDWNVDLEFVSRDMLAEFGQNSPSNIDVLLRSNSSVVAVESKFVADARDGFGPCSQWPKKCHGFYGPGSDKQTNTQAWCRLEIWDGDRSPRYYWSLGKSFFQDSVFVRQRLGDRCPFRSGHYQLMRNFLFAAAYAQRKGLRAFGLTVIVPTGTSYVIHEQVQSFCETILQPQFHRNVHLVTYEQLIEVLRSCNDLDSQSLANFLGRRIDHLVLGKAVDTTWKQPDAFLAAESSFGNAKNSLGSPRFERSVQPNISRLIETGGPLQFLVTSLKQLLPSEPYAFDVQIRPANVIQIYHGTTSLLYIRLNGIEARCEAASTYRQSDEFGFLRSWKLNELHGESFEPSLCRYLVAAAQQAGRRYYSNRKEGYWQNRLVHSYGREWTAEKDWLIVDREAVLSFENGLKQKEFYSPHKNRYLDVRRTLRLENPTLWGTHQESDNLGDELDLLAIDRDGDLVCIELKHGSDAAGVYWGPLQAAVYRDCFQAAVKSISSDVKMLIHQKISMGLLPESVESRLPSDGFKSAKAILLVAEPNIKSSCWTRIRELFEICPEARMPIWFVDEGGLRPGLSTR